MALNALEGAGTSLSANFYLRRFYTANADARTSSKRSSYKDTELSLADGMALRRAVKSLSSFEYDKSNEENIRSSVSAYISTYNNALSSLGKSDDASLTRNLKQLKNLSREYSRELDKIGITVNADGTLTTRDSLFKTASCEKLEKLFSKDSDYMQRAAACGKRIERRSEELTLAERKKQLAESANTAANADTGAANMNTAGTAAAQIVAESLNLVPTLPAGIGKNINIVL